ncbi:hypothetical protein JOQ06_030321 [Pogonophryne albipinna]|uniref:YqaJ viral recombinase domain-containing protein n=1 Tax=Pogonophryne albipinna TaxID=1090488 RepID=A0AAD6FH53_9TELE|nr:hypothetical protein JOQ06_030321 [Pogonophryne albipinna]
MSEETYVYLCNKLRPAMERQDTPFRECIPLKKRVAIALWKLATGSEYRSIGHLFGVSNTTVCRCVQDFCAAAETLLVPELIRSPDREQFAEMAAYTENRPFKKPWCFSQHEVTEEEIENVERATIRQASCVQWHQERVGRITGSIAHRVLTATELPSKSLINTICEQRHRPIMKPWIQWGRHHEQDAIDTHQYALGANLSSTIYICAPVDAPHQNLVVRKTGFRICQTMPYLGVSCDGYVSCDCCGEGVIEA